MQSNKIPFHDLSKQYQNLKTEIHAGLEDVCSTSSFCSGPFVERFEANFARFCEANFCVGVNSGTSALHLALMALGVGSGDEVIVPANTFIATAWAVSYLGGIPVFVDCLSDTWNIDPEQIEKKITRKTRAIIGVHLYGQPFDIESIGAISGKHGIPLLEDCAQAHGARYKGKRVGSLSQAGCFSFYPGKNLGAYGEGGAVICNLQSISDHIKRLRNHGSRERYYHDELGFNMRMDGFQGAILDIKLKYLEGWNSRRREIASMYIRGIKNPEVRLQFQPEWAESVFHLFVVEVNNRERLKTHLDEYGISFGLHYPVPCHLQKAYAFLGYKKGNLPNAEHLAEHCVSLPMFPELTNDQVNSVIKAINEF